MSDRVGQRLDDYRLVRWLGGGTFDDVYLGEHLFEKKTLAIKVLKVRLTQETIKSFLREARTIRLQHPNIVRVLDFGIDEQTPFLVMEYASHGTLQQRHPPGSRLTPTTLLPYVQQATSALQYAHERRLIHRNVKPQNMLLGPHGELLLSDFGIAVIAHSESSFSASEMAGTAAYMAPEQIRGKPCPSSDQYALGVIVYEWLCGERPFQGSQLEVIVQHAQVQPPPLRTRLPTISPAIEAVVMHTLAKEPQQRFADVRSFALALERAIQTSLERTLPSDALTASPLPPTLTPSPTQPHLRERLTAPGLVAFAPSQPSSEQATPPVSTPGTLPVRPTSRKQSLPKGSAALLIILAVLLIAGGSYYTYSAQRTSSLNMQATAIANMRATIAAPTVRAITTARAVVNAYNDAVVQHGIMFGFDAQHTHSNPYEKFINTTNVSQLQQKWTALTGDGIYSSPTVANGVVYVGSEDHKLYAFDAVTGQQKWVASTEWTINSSPAIANGLVYIGSNDGKFYAFDAATGQQKWAISAGIAISSSPTVANGLIYVGSGDHKLYAFDAVTGQQKWAALTGGIIHSSPAVANGLVYVGSFDHKLYAFDAVTGQQKWAALTGGIIYSSPAVANGLVYVGSDDKKFYAFDAVTGQPRWFAPARDIINSSPALANGLVYVGSDDHKLYAFDAIKGELVWAAVVGDIINSSPTVANGVIYVSSWNYNLYAFDAATGQRKWTAPTGNTVDSSPAVANGWVYVGSNDRRLYAFSLPGQTP